MGGLEGSEVEDDGCKGLRIDESLGPDQAKGDDEKKKHEKAQEKEDAPNTTCRQEDGNHHNDEAAQARRDHAEGQ